jgi:hypothetical protein
MIIKLIYFCTCQQRVSYNWLAMKVRIIGGRIMIEPELELELELGLQSNLKQYKSRDNMMVIQLITIKEKEM